MKKSKKLTINRETLQDLRPAGLERVQGGWDLTDMCRSADCPPTVWLSDLCGSQTICGPFH